MTAPIRRTLLAMLLLAGSAGAQDDELDFLFEDEPETRSDASPDNGATAGRSGAEGPQESTPESATTAGGEGDGDGAEGGSTEESEAPQPDAAVTEDAGDGQALESIPVGQAEEPETVPRQRGRTIEEIVVTARKREESIQDVPLSVSAIPGSKMADAGYATLSGITNLAPNVEMESAAPGLNFTYIRGIGTRRFDPGVDQSVATFVDGVYRGRPYTINAHLLDAERVEVLRGPQGTLYGKNTIGGAISITTRAPAPDWQGSLGYEYGNSAVSRDGFDNVSLVASGPLGGDELGLNLAGLWRQRDGYGTVLDDDPPDGAVRDGIAGGGEDNVMGHARLSWNPGDALRIKIAGGFAHLNGPPALFYPNAHGEPDAQVILQSPRAQTPPASGDPRIVASDVEGLRNVIRSTPVSASLEWSGERWSMTSISGYEKSTFVELIDNDGTGLESLARTTDESLRQLSEELRLSGDFRSVQALFGLYYGSERLRRLEVAHAGVDSLVADANGMQPVDLAWATDLEGVSTAVFGQLNWNLSDALALTLGLRYSRDRKEMHLVAENDASTPPEVFSRLAEEYDFMTSRDWSSVDPLASLSWRLRDDATLYATYATGYKSGGFQWIAISEANARRLFDPERVKNYEIGAKTLLWDSRVRLNAAAFYMDYRDLQVLTVDTSGAVPLAVAQNAAQSTVQGLELESEILLWDAVSLEGSYAYLDAVYDDYLQDPEDPASQRAGNFLARSPEHSFNVGLSWSDQLGPGSLQARVGYAWKSSYFWEPDNNQPERDEEEAAFGLLEASLYYRIGRFTAGLWGQNLTDELYRSLVVDIGVSNSFGRPNMVYDVYGPPRTAGFRLSYDWGD